MVFDGQRLVPFKPGFEQALLVFGAGFFAAVFIAQVDFNAGDLTAEPGQGIL